MDQVDRVCINRFASVGAEKTEFVKHWEVLELHNSGSVRLVHIDVRTSLAMYITESTDQRPTPIVVQAIPDLRVIRPYMDLLFLLRRA
jgi:hypothetical protein